ENWGYYIWQGNWVGERRGFEYNTLDQLTRSYLGQESNPRLANVHEYDPLGRLKKDTGPFGQVLVYAYDAGNRIVRTTDSFAGVTESVYDLAERLRVRKWSGSGVTARSVRWAYEADPSGAGLLDRERYRSYYNAVDASPSQWVMQTETR